MNDRKKVLELFEEQKAFMEDRVNSGIERNRKGYAHITVKNREGNPVEGARIRVSQKSHEFRYGANLFMLEELETPQKNEAYKKYFSQLCNIATLPFYWDATEPQRGKTRYAKDSEKLYRRPPIDQCIEFCEANGIEPREHALAYAHFFPKWLEGADTQEVKATLEKRFREISERYAEKIPVIEVTNEMCWEKESIAFYDEDDYIEFCFKLAEKYFPANKLCINEWSSFWEGNGRSTDFYYSYIENAMLKGARIDAVGMQYHMFFKKEEEYRAMRKSYDPVQLYRILDRYAKLGKPIEITEVTIPAYSQDAEDEEIQAKLIENLYSIWFSHENVEQIIYWNLVDGYAAFAPQGDMTSSENYYYGGLLRFDMTPKPAYYTIKNLFEKTWHTEGSRRLKDMGLPNVKALKPGETVIVGDIQIKAVTAKHTVEAFGVILRAEGKTLYFSGDTLYDEKLFEIAQEKPDITFICINGRLGNMNVEEAADTARRIHAGVNVPNHYGMFASNTENPEKFTALVDNGFIMEYNREYIVDKSGGLVEEM